MNLCPTCGHILPLEPSGDLTDAELDVLSVWWGPPPRSTRAVARFLGLSEQTIKNHLYNARIRNGVHTTRELAQRCMEQLRTVDEVMKSHNQRRRVAA